MKTQTQPLLDAARVIVLTPHIRNYLEEHDPKALIQLELAIAAATVPTPSRVIRRESRITWLRKEIESQRRWIADCGGDLAGYVARYGAPGLARCSGDGGEAIYSADVGELERLENELRAEEASQ